jgi:MerR family transcriptional regulator, light-induced transcriptional regulator
LNASSSITAADVYAEYLAALLEADRRRAFATVDRALRAGLELTDLYLEVFQRSLREIGRLWQENEITVADEHVATAITQGAMARAFEDAFDWDGGERPTLVAACADTERHEVGLRMICDLLEVRGWDTTYLGATVPVDSLVVMVGRKAPDAVALSASIAPHIPRLRLMIEQIRSLVASPPLILVGGRPFLGDPSLATRIGADLTAPDAASAVELLQSRIRSGPR